MSTQVLPELDAACRPRALSRYAQYLGAAGFVAVAWLIYHLFLPIAKFPLDDPYITLHSAQVLHWGFDPNYPGVSPLYGATSAPFLGLIYLLLFVLQPLRALETACWLSIFAYVLGLVHLTRVLKLPRFATFAIITLGLTSSLIPAQLLNGLETTWAMAAIVWALSCESDGKHLQAAFAAGLTGAIRPDLLPFTIFFLAAIGWQLTPKSRLQSLPRLIAAAITPVALCSIAYMVGTGYPFPLTGIAKRYYIASGHLPTGQKIGMELLVFVVFLVSCGPLLAALKRMNRHPVTIAILGSAAVAVISFYIQFPDGLASNRFRYSVVFAPMMIWALAVLAQKATANRLLISCLIYSFVLTLPYGLYIYIHDVRTYDTAIHEAADWCNKNLPRDARIMVEDAGYIAYATKFRIVDCAGLKSPEAIELNRNFTWPSYGENRAQAMADLALQDNANYLISLREHVGLREAPLKIQALGWNVQLLKNVKLYAIYHLSPPEHTPKMASANTPAAPHTGSQ